MSKNPDSGEALYGGFDGVDESEDGAKVVTESVNVCFDGKKMWRRRGRSKLIDTNILTSFRLVYFTGSSVQTPEDNATIAALSDGDITTTAKTSVLAAAGDFIYIGCPFRFSGVRITVTAATSTNTTMTASYWDRGNGAALGGWLGLAFTDGTSSGGFTLKQTGNVTWTAAATASNTWTPGGVNGIASIDEQTNIKFPDLFWVRIGANAGLTGLSLSEVQTLLQATDQSIRTEPYGMTEFITRTGDRYIVATHDYPGIFTADALQPTRSDCRVIAYDLSRGYGIPLRIPKSITHTVVPGTITSFVTFNGWLIGSLSNGRLFKWDGTTAGELESKIGIDARNGVVGALSYLPQGARGTILETYRNRLMVAGNPDSPLTFYASMEDNNISLIPPDATVGGPNVWPLNYVFNVPAQDGDKITGAKVINDRYVILTRNSTWVFDDASLKNTNADIGCVAPASVQKIDNSLFFLSEHGVIRSDGLNFDVISGPVQKTLDMCSVQAMRQAVGIHHKNEGEYWLWLAIGGELQNSLAVVYDYRRNFWRILSGWYPWDTTARRGTNGSIHNVTAACLVAGADTMKRVVTMDASGNMYEEDTGYDDQGVHYPAYAALKELENKNLRLNFRAWNIDVECDGQWLEFYALNDGAIFGQEIDKRFANATLESEIVHKQALQQNTRGGPTQNIFSSGAWGDANTIPRLRRMLASFGRNMQKLRPVINWVSGQFSAGSYINSVGARGAIQSIEFDVAEKE